MSLPRGGLGVLPITRTPALGAVYLGLEPDPS